MKKITLYPVELSICFEMLSTKVGSSKTLCFVISPLQKLLIFLKLVVIKVSKTLYCVIPPLAQQ